MSVPLEIPEWLVAQSAPPPPPPVDDHRVESLVNGFIAGKQDALFDAPDAYYRQQGADALDGAPAIAERLQDLRSATLDLARDDGERAAIAPPRSSTTTTARSPASPRPTQRRFSMTRTRRGPQTGTASLASAATSSLLSRAHTASINGWM